MGRLAALLAVALLLTACAPRATPGETPAASTPAAAAPAKVSVAIGSAPSLFYLPFDVAKALKYYQAEGLDVELQYLPDGARAASALASGAAQFSGNALDQAIRAQAQGNDLKMVVSFTRLPGIALMVRSDLTEQIKEVKDFKGRKIGVTSIGSATHVLAQALAVQAGLKPEELTIVPTGASTMAEAFDARLIDVGFNADPFTTQLLKSGKVALLADLRTEADTTRYLGGEFQNTGALVSGDTIKQQPALIQKMVVALARAQFYMRTHTAREMAEALPNDVTGQDKQAWAEALTATRETLSMDGRLSQAGVENALEAYRIFGTFAPNDRIDVQALYDNSFIEKALQR